MKLLVYQKSEWSCFSCFLTVQKAHCFLENSLEKEEVAL